MLVLSKRQYMSHDLLDERYGRFRELPLAMAAQGALVRGLCLSYRRRPDVAVTDGAGDAVVEWQSLGLRRLLPVGTRSYWAALDELGGRFRPDVIWACSDVPHAVLGVAAARRLGARLVIDLYDNFESYPLSKIPGVNAALHRAVKSANGVTCISAPLAELVREKFGFNGPIEVVENAVPAGRFYPRDRTECRKQFGLPAGALLVGTAGAISHSRGIQCLLEAFRRVAPRRPDIHLVLAGPLDGHVRLPRSDRVHYLGMLPAEQVPPLLSALDVSVISNRDSSFGRYCFPQKLFESIACGVPVAVANVGAAAQLLRDYPGNLYQPDDVDDLVMTIERQCEAAVVPQVPVPTWTTLATRLLNFLSSNPDD